MTDRSAEGPATEPDRSRRGGPGRWPARTRALWVLCAVAYGIFLVKFFWFARASAFTEWGGMLPVHGPDKIIVSFRNDDLSVYSNPALEDSVISLFKAHGVRQTFAFIPDPAGYIGGAIKQPPGNQRIVELLRQWEREGVVEFALHGFTHLKNNVGAGEFDGLPAETQNRLIREGKAILDSTLGTNVRIFAPPWNQADVYTVEACSRAGIDKISGYIGTPPVRGTMAVNTNAELFFSPGEIPPVDRVLDMARSGSGTRFVNVFYHSRVDFQNPGAFRRVDSLLTTLRADPKVEILSLGEIAGRYAGYLKPCSESGWNIIEAENAMKSAKPYLSFFSRVPLVRGHVHDLERRHLLALESYWCGNYAAAHVQAGSVVRQSGNWLAFGRLVALLGVAVILGVLFFTHTSRTMVIRVYAVTIILILLVTVVLAVASHISPERVGEIAQLGVVVVGGLLLVLPWLPQLQSTSVDFPSLIAS